MKRTWGSNPRTLFPPRYTLTALLLVACVAFILGVVVMQKMGATI